MFRLLNAGFRIIALALLAIIALAIEYPWWTAGTLIVLYFLGRHLQAQEARRRLTLDPLTLSPIEYENYCADLLRQAGWKVWTTPRQDQGVDVVAVLRGVRIALQAKRWNQRVGNRSVQEIVAGRRHYACTVAVVVSPSGYTRSARELAVSNGVILLHHNHLANLEKIARIP